MLAGELVGTLDGSPVRLNADERGLTLSVRPSLRAWRALRKTSSSARTIRRTRRIGVPVRVATGPFTLAKFIA